MVSVMAWLGALAWSIRRPGDEIGQREESFRHVFQLWQGARTAHWTALTMKALALQIPRPRKKTLRPSVW